MYYPNPNQYRPTLDPYQKLGNRFRNFAIVSLIYGILNQLDTILLDLGVPITTSVTILGQVFGIDPLSIVVSILLIFVFVLQVLIIIFAKKASSQFSKPALNQYGTYIILSIVFSIASRIINVFWVFTYILNNSVGTFSILPYTLASSIVMICSVTFQLMAWFLMAKFFKETDAVDIKARSMNSTILVQIALFIYLGKAVVIGISLAIMESVVTFDTHGLSSYNIPDIAFAFDIIGAASMIVVYILACIGYFKVGDAFVSFGPIAPPAFAPPSTSMASPGNASFSPTQPAGSKPESMRESSMTCPYCGARFPVNSGMQFCPSCGARFRPNG